MTATAATVIAIAGVSGAVLLGGGRGAGARRLARLLSAQQPDPASAPRTAPSGEVRPARLPAAVLAGLAVLMFIGGLAGVGLAVVAGVASHHLLGRLEPRAAVAEREQAARDLPLAVHLLAATAAAGSSPTSSLALVADVVGGPIGLELRRIAAVVDLGGDVAATWRTVGAESPLAPVSRTVARAVESGTGLAGALDRLADELQAQHRATLDRQVRSVGVRASAPLALCFLPAFLLIGVVPIVVGMASDVLGRL